MTTNPAINLTPEERAAKIAEKEMELAEAKQELAEALQKANEIAQREALRVLKNHALGAPVTPSMTSEEARETVMAHLIEALEIPLHPGICKVLVSGGFDESHITQGKLNGTAVGYAAGVPLLKFVGFLHDDAPTIQEAALLMSIGDGDTKH